MCTGQVGYFWTLQPREEEGCTARLLSLNFSLIVPGWSVCVLSCHTQTHTYTQHATHTRGRAHGHQDLHCSTAEAWASVAFCGHPPSAAVSNQQRQLTQNFRRRNKTTHLCTHLVFLTPRPDRSDSAAPLALLVSFHSGSGRGRLAAREARRQKGVGQSLFTGCFLFFCLFRSQKKCNCRKKGARKVYDRVA